jgi:outer membrane protein
VAVASATGEHNVKRATRFAAALALGCCLAQPSRAVDLIEVYRMAVESDPTLAAAVSANKAAQELKPQARAGLLPNVQIQGDTSYVDQEVKRSLSGISRRGSSKDNAHGYTLSLVQPVFRWDRWIQLAQADNRVSQANAELDAATQELIVRTAEAYFEVLRTQDNLEFRTTTKEAFLQQLNQALQRFEVGLIAITDVEEARAGHDLAVAEEIRARNELENAYEALRALINEYQRDLAPLAAEVPLLMPEPNSIEQWADTALAQNRQLAASTFAAKVAQDEIRRQQAGHYPTLDLVASRGSQRGASPAIEGLETSSGGVTRSWEDAIGLQVTVPIYQGGLVTSQTRQARHEYQQALDVLEQTRRETYRSARQSFLGVQDTISGVNALRTALGSTQKALEATEAGFQVGTRTSVDVLNAQQRTYESRYNYKNAQYSYILTTLRLKQAAGTLSPDDLVPINGWLKH